MCIRDSVYVANPKLTYDLDDVTQAIVSAKARTPQLDARVLIDREQAMTGNTRNLRPRVLQLTSHGIQVRLFSRCRLHAKSLLTDVRQDWGSLNWTSASLRNVERCVVTSLPIGRLAEELQWCNGLWEEGKPFQGREPAEEIITPVRRGGVTQLV